MKNSTHVISLKHLDKVFHSKEDKFVKNKKFIESLLSFASNKFLLKALYKKSISCFKTLEIVKIPTNGLKLVTETQDLRMM
jgi:hypothetical protein